MDLFPEVLDPTLYVVFLFGVGLFLVATIAGALRAVNKSTMVLVQILGVVILVLGTYWVITQ